MTLEEELLAKWLRQRGSSIILYRWKLQCRRQVQDPEESGKFSLWMSEKYPSLYAQFMKEYVM